MTPPRTRITPLLVKMELVLNNHKNQSMNNPITKELEVFPYNSRRSSEFYFSGKPTNRNSFIEQTNQVLALLSTILVEHSLKPNNIITTKIYLSDYLNQKEELYKHPLLTKLAHSSAVSIIEQAPCDGTKINVLIYCIENISNKKTSEDNCLCLQTENYTHYYHSRKSASVEGLNLREQTRNIFNNYITQIEHKNLNIKDHCIRTWLYIRDIDKMYMDVVKERKTLFEENKLTNKTHYITSTGIEGKTDSLEKDLCVDFYTIEGISSNQVQHLQATNYLNPTYEYGVTFERGTCVSYGDRKHVFISGTASIDNKGNTIFIGDVNKQMQRIIINIEALLADADAHLNDIACLTIYLRDYSDYQDVNDYFEKYFKGIPKVIVIGKVCRPNWLIEVECIAIAPHKQNLFADF